MLAALDRDHVVRHLAGDHRARADSGPVADFHRLLARGDNYYRGFAIGASKFTGTTNLPSVLVVRIDDPTERLQDLQGAKYGYINKSCSSSYFPPAILLGQQGRKFDDFLDIVPTAAFSSATACVRSPSAA